MTNEMMFALWLAETHGDDAADLDPVELEELWSDWRISLDREPGDEITTRSGPMPARTTGPCKPLSLWRTE